MSESNYEPKAVVSTIKATSRASVKIRDNYFTAEYSEERIIPNDIPTIDIEKEREALWDAVNNECDNQIEMTIKIMTQRQQQSS